MRLRLLLFAFLTVFLFSKTQAQCLEITSILINACNPTSNEEDNEMVTFTVGATSLNVTDIAIDWPNLTFNGWCTSPSATAGLNATITNGCGFLIEPPLGQIPANANVILITSDNVSTVDNTFAGLTDTLYVVYQCDGLNTAQFVNSSGTGTRTTTFTVSGPCSQVESVTYDRQFLTNTDGERVYFDAVGNATYDNTQGCTALVTGLSADWSFTDEICNTYGVVDLTTLLSGGATPGGTWSGPRVTGTNYDPTGYLGVDSVSYSIVGTGTCTATVDSTIVFNVVQEETGTFSTQSCDSVFFNGTWYSANTTFADTTFGSGYACDSFTNITITINSAITDSSYLVGCDSITFNGTTYMADIILRDTIPGGGGPAVIDTILQTGFEDSEGWMDHGSGNWTQVDANGTWTANGMYANQFNPNNGIRNVGLNDVGDYLEFPAVDNPQTLYYFDRLSSAATGTNELTVEYFDGAAWQVISSDICTHIVYDLVTVDLSGISGLTGVPIRILRTSDNRSAYIDDIVIVGSTSGAGASCDSIIITNININPSSQTTTNVTSCDAANVGSVSTSHTNQFGCDSTHTVVTTLGTANTSVQTLTICDGDSTLLGGSFQTTAGSYYDTIPGGGGGPGVFDYFYVETFDGALTWTLNTSTGVNGADNNFWVINNNEGGTPVGGCGSAGGNNTLHITSVFNPTGGAAYDAGGLCGLLFCPETNQAASSGAISTLGRSTLSLEFDFISLGEGLNDNASVLYSIDGGVSYLPLTASIKSATCVGGQGLWQHYAAALPANAENIPDLRVRINWTNNDDGVGSDPSVAINDLFISSFIPSTAGCDTIVETQLSFFPAATSNPVNLTACDTVNYNGTDYTSSTTFTDTLSSVNNCDSLYNVVTIIVNNAVTVLNPGNPFVICSANDSVQLPGGGYASTAGFYNDTLVGPNTCDSIVTTEVQTQNCGCFFDDVSKTFWVKADTLLLNGAAPVTAGTATEWGNIVANPLVPNLNGLAGGGTRTIIQNEPTFNFNSTMDFVNAGFARGGLPNNAILDPNEGSMFVVSTQAGLSFSYVVGTAGTGVCGGNRCSTGFRGNRSEFASANNLFTGATTPNVANVLGMSGNAGTPTQRNSINGVTATGAAASSIPVSTATVNYQVGLGVWPGFVMTGQIAEAIAFNRELTTNEYEIVETYLSVKYGTTLSHSYFASDYDGTTGTIPYVVGIGYDNNIAGIGRDDCFDLEQTISHSVAPNAIITMALTDNGGTYSSPNNFDNNLEFLMWGNDGGTTDFSCSTNTPAGYNQLYNREWEVQQNGVVGNTDIAFNLANANLTGVAADYALVIDTDNDGFYSDETAISGTIVGGELIFAGIDLDNESFTLVANSEVNVTVNDPICNNGTYTLPGGTVVSQPGTYMDTLTSTSACDSIVTTILTLVICDCSFDLGPDTTFCQGESLLLDAGPGFDTYTWQDNSMNQTFTANTTGTYYCTTTFIDSANNLVVNGDFEQGNTGFTSDYGPPSGGQWNLNAGEYEIATVSSHPNLNSCTVDHTPTGVGNMMIVNGSNTPNTNVWCQTITVVPNTDYIFSAWAMSLENTNAANVATLHFLVDGVQIGVNYSPSFTACNWGQFTANYNSGANVSIQICIESDVIAGNNDYALDDIFFTPFCNYTDTIDVTVNPIPTPNIGPDLTICQGSDTLLDATTANATYLWQDGTTTTATFTASTAGTYSVDVTVDGCTGSDTLTLATTPVFNQTANVSICAGDSAFLENAWQTQAGVYTDNFTTSSNCDSTLVTTLSVVVLQINNDTITVCEDELPVLVNGNLVSLPGEYSDTITSSLACDSIINVTELIVNPLPVVSVGSDTLTTDEGSTITLSVVNADPNDTYTWTNDLGDTFTGSSIQTSATQSTEFILTATNQFDCSDADSILVIVNPIQQTSLQIPTAFSPNGDGINEVFRIANYEEFESYVLRVYNRWGELIFDNEGYNVSWDGTYKEVPQNIGAYVYYIQAKPLAGGDEMSTSGSVTLIK